MSASILLTRHDASRLEALFESPRYRGCAEVDALGYEIARAELCEILPHGVIGMSSRATFVNEKDGRERSITLAYPHEVDGGPERISVLSAVGTALLGLSVGQRIEWALPGGEMAVLRVTSVEPSST